MKKLKRANSLFLQYEISSVVLKTWITNETKTQITQNFQILYPIQGGTMRKLTSQGFRKCGTGINEMLKKSNREEKEKFEFLFSIFEKRKRK